jgi:phage head maturation protease
MAIQKAHWLNDADNVHLIMPFAKVDTEHRTVSGFASLNNVDKTDDVVTANASANAFASFRGNIREMHDSHKAVGTMVNFSQEPYYDAESGNTYQGIYVTCYVSKGAQDTWEKVLDGTLSGFSIGGHILEQHQEYVAELSKTVRFITELSLFELSLVDNPANQFANVFSIQKVDGELVMKGMATEVETQNVFWCEEDKTARAADSDHSTCVQCSADMENIGWIEVTDAASAPAELKKFVDEWTTTKVITTQDLKDAGKEQVQQNSEFANEENVGDNTIDTAKSEGGVNMSDVETVEKAAEVDEVVETPAEVVEKAEEVVETPEETVEKAEEVVEEETVETVEKAEEAVVETPEVDVTKALEDIKNFVSEAVTKSATEQATSLEAIAKAMSDLAESVAKLAPVAEAVQTVTEKVEGLERATAVKKSGDGDESEPVKKGFSWGGHFASASTITQ